MLGFYTAEVCKMTPETRRTDKERTGLPMTKCNETMGDIIRGNPYCDAVPRNDSDTMTSHFPAEFGENLHIIIVRQCDRIQIAFVDVRNRSFYLDQIVSCHSAPYYRVRFHTEMLFDVACIEKLSPQPLESPVYSGVVHTTLV